MGMAKNGAAAARDRARAARARLDAERAGHEKKHRGPGHDYYLAADALAAAETAAAQARADMAASVGVLVEQLKEPVERVAALCGITTAEARLLRKTAKGSAQTSSGPPAPVTPVPDRGPAEPAPDETGKASTPVEPAEPDPAEATEKAAS